MFFYFFYIKNARSSITRTLKAGTQKSFSNSKTVLNTTLEKYTKINKCIFKKSAH